MGQSYWYSTTLWYTSSNFHIFFSPCEECEKPMWAWAILNEAQLDLFEHAPCYMTFWWAWTWRCTLAWCWACWGHINLHGCSGWWNIFWWGGCWHQRLHDEDFNGELVPRVWEVEGDEVAVCDWRICVL